MKNLLSAKIDFGYPVIAAPITDQTSSSALTSAKNAGLDVAELRFDKMSEYSDEAAFSELHRLDGLLKLLTMRAAFEGGEWREDEASRLHWFKTLIPAVDAIDIELAADDIRDKVIEFAKSNAKTVIVSHHNFDATPSFASLEQVISSGFEKGADIVKIACMTHSAQDIQCLAKLLLNNNDKPLIVIGMGDWGMPTRVMFPAYGSQLTFAHIGESSAAGQMHLDDFQAEINKYYP